MIFDLAATGTLAVDLHALLAGHERAAAVPLDGSPRRARYLRFRQRRLEMGSPPPPHALAEITIDGTFDAATA